MTVCKDDVVTLGNYTDLPACATNAVSIKEGEGGAKDSTFGRSLSHKVDSNKQCTLTITFTAETHIDFISVKAAARTVSFVLDEAGKGTGTFSDGTETVTFITVSGLGATYALDSTDSTKVNFVDGTQTPYVKAVTGDSSIFRHWTGLTTDPTVIVDNITLKAKFVKDTVELHLVANTGSQEASIPAGTLTVPMDSTFQPDDAYVDTLNAKAVFKKSGVADTSHALSVKSSDEIKYKFKNPPFEVLKGGNYISDTVEAYSDIETTGLTLTYNIIVRDTHIVTIDLDRGHFVDYSLPQVKEEIGGQGAWKADETLSKYTNTFYEEYSINDIFKTYVPTDTKVVDRHDGFFLGTWQGTTVGQLTTDLTYKANYAMAHHVVGTVSDKDGELEGATVTVSTKDNTPIDPSAKSFIETTTNAIGYYDVKVYEDKNLLIEVGDKTHIYQTDEVATIKFDVEKNFTLEDGYTWLPREFTGPT